MSTPRIEIAPSNGHPEHWDIYVDGLPTFGATDEREARVASSWLACNWHLLKQHFNPQPAPDDGGPIF